MTEAEKIQLQGCSDGSCLLRDKRGGMQTNGGCHCLDDLPTDQRRQVTRYIYFLRHERDCLKAQLEELNDFTMEIDT